MFGMARAADGTPLILLSIQDRHVNRRRDAAYWHAYRAGSDAEAESFQHLLYLWGGASLTIGALAAFFAAILSPDGLELIGQFTLFIVAGVVGFASYMQIRKTVMKRELYDPAYAIPLDRSVARNVVVVGGILSIVVVAVLLFMGFDGLLTGMTAGWAPVERNYLAVALMAGTTTAILCFGCKLVALPGITRLRAPAHP